MRPSSRAIQSAEAGAQGVAETRASLESALRPGDQVTVHVATDTDIRGRFVALPPEGLVLDTDGTRRSIALGDIESVRRRRNGVRLGAVVGAGAGFALGLPYRAAWETARGKGNRALLTSVAIGLATGVGIDALVSLNGVVYRRKDGSPLGLRVTPDGAGVRVAIGW